MTCRWAWLRPSRSVLARTSPGSRWYRTRVAVSASRPAASSAVRVPASPAALRSPRWCITRMFCTPYWRASLKLACCSSATLGEASRCHASSWTTIRRVPSARVHTPRSQLATQAIRIGLAWSGICDRLTETIGPSSDRPGLVGSSNRPAKRERHVAAPLAQLVRGGLQRRGCGRVGPQQVRDHVADDELAPAAPGGAFQWRGRLLEGRVFAWLEAPVQQQLSDRPQQRQATRATDGWVEGVEPEVPAAQEPDRGHPERRAEPVVLALDVGDQGDVAEQGLPVQVQLDQAALAVADVPEHQHVGSVELAGLIEAERVEPEHAPQRVTADDRPRGIERCVGEERVDGLGVAGGAAIWGAVGSCFDPHPGLLGVSSVQPA